MLSCVRSFLLIVDGKMGPALQKFSLHAAFQYALLYTAAYTEGDVRKELALDSTSECGESSQWQEGGWSTLEFNSV